MMSPDKNNDNWEGMVEAMKNQHNPPGQVPRDLMWDRIDAARMSKRGHQSSPVPKGRVVGVISPRIWRMAAAAAAVLVLGVAIGRMTLPGASNPGPERPQVATTQPGLTSEPTAKTPASNLLYQKATSDLFNRADMLLTGFKVTSCAEESLGAVPDWASGMLLQTRLLMSTPVAQDQEMKNLLLDLELVLAQIVGINKDNCARDAAWIRDTMAEKSTLERLRMMGPNPALRDAI